MSVYKRDSYGCIVRRGEGTWWYDFTIDGKRYKKGLRGIRTRKEAEAIESQIRASVYTGTYGKQRQAITFEKFVNAIYLPHVKNTLRSFYNYSVFAKHICEYFKGKMLDEITPADIEAYRQHRLHPGGNDKAAQPNTINRDVMQMSGMFALGVRLEYLSSNPCKKIKAFKADNHKDRVITPQEEKTLLDALKEKHRPIVILALNTGMRIGEILGLKWSYVDLEKAEITLPANTTKNGKSRIIPLLDAPLEALRNLHQVNRDKAKVFVGKGYQRHSVSIAVSKVCKEIGLTDVSMHTMRHTFITRCIEQNMNPFHVKAIVGHSSLRMTDKYTHIGMDVLRTSIKTLEKSSDNSPSVPTS